MSSSYYKLLNDDYKRRYMEKLSFCDLQLPDPLDEDLRRLVFNSQRWPNISIFDIYTYLVHKHKMYSKLAFKDYTSVPCYNYVLSGKVKNLKCYRNEVGVSVITADVEASQKAKKIHLPWIVSTNDGEIISAHCTCMAGLGETCSHVGATLFLVEQKVREEREKPACTSEPCTWNKTSSKVESLPVYKINFNKPKRQKMSKRMPKVYPMASDASFKKFLQNVKTILPTAAIFNAFSDSEDTDTADEDSGDKIFTFAEKVDKFVQSLPKKSTPSERQKAFETMFFISDIERKAIENKTKEKEIWQKERKGRITASNFGKVLKCKNAYDSILCNIMGYQKEICTEPMAWGKNMEKVAKEEFLRLVSPLHVNLCIEPTGLYVDKDQPYLGASPDGLVTCDCCEDHLLEIKCPYSQRGKRLRDVEKKNFFLDENEILKEGHCYFDQVQGQMGICGVTKCYFVTFTEAEMHYQIVHFDEMKWEDTKAALNLFFFNVVFPEIISSQHLKAIKKAAEQCFCKREKVVSLIQCNICKISFHRSCVKHLKKSAWSCAKCVSNLKLMP